MIVEKIKVKNFKKFEGIKEIKFNEDINVLIGDNEAGKSTILTALDIVFSGSFSKVEALGIDTLFNDNDIVKLFYQNSKNYKGNVENWGNSKGFTYDNVCVVLNKKTYDLYKKGNLNSLTMSTRNKLYVACTRTKNNLFFIEESKIKKFKKGD